MLYECPECGLELEEDDSCEECGLTAVPQYMATDYDDDGEDD